MKARHRTRPLSSEIAIHANVVESPLASLTPCAGGLVLIAILAAANSLWPVQLILILLLLTVPGVILLRALRVPGMAIEAFPVYVPASSLVVLIGSGLAVDWTGSLFGIRTPLRKGPLLLGFEVLCFMLLAASAHAPTTVKITWSSLSGRSRLILPFISLPIVASGAVLLNNGHGKTVSLIGLVVIFILLIFGMSFASRISSSCLAVILYVAGVATMWSFSLRSSFVYGFDIASEYRVMNETIIAGALTTLHTGDAYGAMLSITLLPAELHAISGMSGIILFKVIYPILFAFFPVAVFSLGRRILPQVWAYMAAMFVIVQSTFVQELPALARQEIALILFTALIGTMLDPHLSRSAQRALVPIFGAVMVVSHYSTTYIAIGITGLVVFLQWAISWIRQEVKISGIVFIGFVTITAGAILWYVPITHSASNMMQLANTLQSQGLNLLPNQPHGGNIIANYLNGNTQTPINASQYSQLVKHEYATQRGFVIPFPDAQSSQYALRNYSLNTRSYARPVAAAFGLAELLIEQLANLFAAIGAIWMCLRRKAILPLSRQISMFAIASLFGLTIIRLSGSVAQEYNQERALIQALLFLSITFCWSVRVFVEKSSRREDVALAVLGAAICVMFFYSTGVNYVFFGGGASANLANDGEAFERFYMTPQELMSARWLGEHFSNGQLVYSDEYGQLRIHAETGITNGLLTDIVPAVLDQNAWIYASRANIIDHQARGFYQGHLAKYVFPIQFISTHYNLVFTDGESELFHG